MTDWWFDDEEAGEDFGGLEPLMEMSAFCNVCGELRGVIVTSYDGYDTTGWMALPFFAIALESGQDIEAEAVWCPRCDSGVLDMIDGGVEVLELFANEKISMDDIKRILGEDDD